MRLPGSTSSSTFPQYAAPLHMLRYAREAHALYIRAKRQRHLHQNLTSPSAHALLTPLTEMATVLNLKLLAAGASEHLVPAPHFGAAMLWSWSRSTGRSDISFSYNRASALAVRCLSMLMTVWDSVPSATTQPGAVHPSLFSPPPQRQTNARTARPAFLPPRAPCYPLTSVPRTCALRPVVLISPSARCSNQTASPSRTLSPASGCALLLRTQAARTQSPDQITRI